LQHIHWQEIQVKKKEIQEAEVFGETEAEFKEFEPWLKNGWFHLKPVFSGFKTWLNFIKFGLGSLLTVEF